MSSQGWTKTRLLAIATMLAVVFTAGGWIAGAQSKDQPAAPERTLRVGEVARVGQEVISAEAFVQKLLEHDNGRAPVARIGQAALIDLIGETLLEAEDKRLECRVKPHEIEKELSAYLDRMRKVWERDEKIRALPKGEEEQAWEEYLKQRVGMTEKELSAYLRP
ncbi:MAG: hypothetical protein OEY28_12360, partial [Nitrospira sp.]|nr:hypothetical protein [Nitrospira sp.]